MSENIIPPLLSGLQPSFSEGQQGLQIQNITPELLKILQSAEVADLEVVSLNKGLAQAILHVGDKAINIVVKGGMLPQGAENITVKIGQDAMLYPVKENPIKPSKDIIISHEPTVNKPEVEPLNLEKFIKTTFPESDIVKQLKSQFADVLPSIKVSMSGADTADDTAVVKILENIFKIPNSQSENLSNIQGKIATELNKLQGLNIKGEVIAKFNDVTKIKTMFGETFFTTKVNIPVHEKILLHIDGLKFIPPFSGGDKFLQELAKNIELPRDIKTIKEILSQSPKFGDLLKNISANDEVLSLVVEKIAINQGNVLSKIYNFYQAATGKDINLFLGKNLKDLDNLPTAVKEKAVEDITRFINSSYRETANWKIVEMPFFDGNVFKPLKIGIKKRGQEGKKSHSSKQEDVRFMIETGFSKLGEFQFDGLSNVKKRKLDLIIRTTQKQDEDFCSHVINLFKKSLYDVDYNGSIKINQQEGFIKIEEANLMDEGIYV